MTCTTHHYACDCREAEFARLREENARLKQIMKNYPPDVCAALTFTEHQRDQLRTLLASAHKAMKQYEMDVDDSPPREHRQLMDEIQAALEQK